MHNLDGIEAQAFESLHNIFRSAGYEIMIAGGAVRDILRGVPPKDIDFATTATPDEMLALEQDFWRVIDVGAGKEHGTLIFMSLYGSFEITALRKDVSSTDGRHAEVEFITDFMEDAARRDFTINAMFLDIKGNVHDFFNGQYDLEHKLVRFVGDPQERIEEDALRMIRAFRMACKFGAEAVLVNKNVIRENRAMIKNVSDERVWSEFEKVCKDTPHRVDIFLDEMEVSGLNDMLEFPHQAHWNPLSSDIIRKMPEIAIAANMDTQWDVSQFCDNFKLSNLQRINMEFFMHHAVLGDEFSENMAQEYLNDGAAKDMLRAIANFREDDFDLLANLSAMEPKQFPVRGSDVMSTFIMKPGPEVGAKLDELKKVWNESKWTLTKEELLAGIHFVPVEIAIGE